MRSGEGAQTALKVKNEVGWDKPSRPAKANQDRGSVANCGWLAVECCQRRRIKPNPWPSGCGVPNRKKQRPGIVEEAAIQIERRAHEP